MRTWLDALLARPTEPRFVLFTILYVAISRMAVEMGVKGHPIGWEILPHAFSDTATLYLMGYFLFWTLLTLLLPQRPGVGKVVAAGLLLGVLPPILERWIPALGGPETFYDYFFEFQLWFYEPSYQPLAETVTVWLTIVGTGAFVAVVSRSVLRTLAALVGAWAALLWGGSLISSLLVGDWTASLHPDRWVMTPAMLATCMVLFHGVRWRAHLPSILRVNHILPFVGLAGVGAAFAGHDAFDTLWRMALVLYLCLVLLIQNDTYDEEEDAHAGRERRATGEDAFWSTTLALFWLLCIARMAPITALCGLSILLLGWVYHHPAARLKQHFCMAYMVEGAGALASFTVGLSSAVAIASDHALAGVTLLVFGGGALLSMPKDWKDIEADRAAGIPTLYVLRSERPEQIRKLHRGLMVSISVGLALATLGLGLRFGWSLPLATLGVLGIGLPWALSLPWSPKQGVRAYMWCLGLWLIGAAWVLRSVLGAPPLWG